MRRCDCACNLPYRGHTARHCMRASRGLVDLKPRKQIICSPRFELSKKRRQVARLALMYKCVTNQTAIDIPGYVYHQSSPKPDHLIHWNLSHFSHPVTRKNTASGRELSLTGIACHLIITLDSTAKLKATISDYIFSVWCLPFSVHLFILIYISISPYFYIS